MLKHELFAIVDNLEIFSKMTTNRFSEYVVDKIKLLKIEDLSPNKSLELKVGLIKQLGGLPSEIQIKYLRHIMDNSDILANKLSIDIYIHIHDKLIEDLSTICVGTNDNLEDIVNRIAKMKIYFLSKSNVDQIKDNIIDNLKKIAEYRKDIPISLIINFLVDSLKGRLSDRLDIISKETSKCESSEVKYMIEKQIIKNVFINGGFVCNIE